MAVDLINVGRVANDGTGDDLREAFLKINRNFEELDLRDDEQTTASNIGDIGEGVFSNKIGYDLQFKKLVAGQDISLTSTDNSIVINSNGGLKTVMIVGDNGSKLLENTSHLNILGGNDISTRVVNNDVIIDYNGLSTLSDDTSPLLSATLNANSNNITNVNTIDATEFVGSFTGNLTGNVHGIDIRSISSFYEPGNLDFGGIFNNVTNLYDWLKVEIDIDMQTFSNPSTNNIDLGSFV